jgi:hypothetical protein
MWGVEIPGLKVEAIDIQLSASFLHAPACLSHLAQSIKRAPGPTSLSLQITSVFWTNREQKLVLPAFTKEQQERRNPHPSAKRGG